ncbi:bridging integrator 3 [Anaeramoeba ignava]|uniref:Bridging integrator 3 n=1 Tax=Anaeramoeba ignava TaxID=1746090 RepID=A0A9Q0REM1_ANAIG|nr:bridging integrator 3 [Anaeramoeba ignava]|eukprot:Anaeramoba_ignava/a96421_27.p1 GENE.a96421_27~~a96421_27.p1  ORF type:complete len:218 (-),score=86.48 a96421_27:31-618(-)
MGKGEKTTDEEFDDFYINFQQDQKETEELKNGILKFMESLEKFQKINKKLGKVLTQISGIENNAFDFLANNSESIENTLDFVEENSIKFFDSRIQMMKDLEQEVKNRNTAQLDYDVARNKLLKEEKSKKKDLKEKLQKNAEESKQKYEQANYSCKEKLQRIHQAKQDVLAPPLFLVHQSYMQTTQMIAFYHDKLV